MKLFLTPIRRYKASILPDLCVKNLPWSIGDQELTEYFTKFGPVCKATVIFDHQTAMSKCFGFVTFKQPDTYDKVLNCDVHVLEGRRLWIKKR